ncbi:MAG: response regulator [Flavobacteriales bacterium]|nr:response regulator [Flavobacteriales bacterium]
MKIQPQEPIPTILYLDDDGANRQAFVSAFRRSNRVFTAADLAGAWETLASEQVHIVIVDQRMPGIQGSEVLGLIKERYPAVRRMLMTGYSDIQAVIDAINRGGVSHYLSKPWNPEQVGQAIATAFADYRRDQDRNEYTQSLIDANRQLEFALRQRLLS